mgnify:FL=1
MYKTYLVTGATGFLGRTVVSELLSRGAAVRALILPGDPLAAALPENVERVEGDLCSAPSLMPFFAGADADTCVIHTAGIVTVASRPDASLYRVNVDGTRTILRECTAHSIGKLVYVSSVHALPEKPKGITIAETDAVSSEFVSGDYAKSKAEATALVFAAARAGLNASIVFPSGIIGPGDLAGGSMTAMFRSFLAGRLPLAVRGGYDFVDVRDVARGIADCAENGQRGCGYILSGHYTTIRNMLETLKTAAGVRRTVTYLPLGFARGAAAVFERFARLGKKKLFFTPYSVNVLGSNALFSHGAASRTFGYEPRPLLTTLRDTARWLRGTKPRPAAT